MEKFLYFNDGDNDVAMYPVHSLIGVTCASNTATIINFANTLGANATEDKRDKITLTHGAGGEILIMKALARAVNATGPQYNDGLIVVADDIDGVYLDATITAVDIDLDS